MRLIKVSILNLPLISFHVILNVLCRSLYRVKSVLNHYSGMNDPRRDNVMPHTFEFFIRAKEWAYMNLRLSRSYLGQIWVRQKKFEYRKGVVCYVGRGRNLSAASCRYSGGSTGSELWWGLHHTSGGRVLGCALHLPCRLMGFNFYNYFKGFSVFFLIKNCPPPILNDLKSPNTYFIS